MICLIIFKIMEAVMKKSLILIAMLAVATTLFAENDTISCESDLGKCTYTISADSFNRECTCRDNTGFADAEIAPEGGTVEATLPTEEECLAELEDTCGNADIFCENEAGECSMETNGEYNCGCYGIFDGYHSGTAESASEESCNAVLVEHCGTEAATANTLCSNDPEIFEICLNYAKSFTNTCYEPLTDEEMEAALDLPAETNDTTAALAACCQDEATRDEFKTSFECLEATESCENKECCETCNVFSLGDEKDDDVIAPAPEDGNADAGDTEVPAEDAVDSDDSAAPTDGADAPTDGAETTAEKEESKSDGCSMLFI